MREFGRFWWRCACIAARGGTTFANDWQWFIGVPVFSAIATYLNAIRDGGPLITGNAIADSFVAALAAFVITWVAFFLARLVMAPGILYRTEKERADKLAAEKKTKSEKQAAIDDLSEEIEWATVHLINKNDGKPWTALDANNTATETQRWTDKIADKLKNQTYFSKSDQIHFAVSGFMTPITPTGFPNLDHMFSVLNNKLDRLRDIIQSHQARL
jgi:hypothetical protein